MVKVTEEEFYNKWSKRLRASSDEIRTGVDRVTESPGKAAAKKIDLMLQKLMEAFESGRVERGLLGFSLEDWQQAMKEKGIRNMPAGIENAKAKQMEFARWLLARVSEGQAKVKAMPEGTLEDSIRRVETYIRHMAEKKYK